MDVTSPGHDPSVSDSRSPSPLPSPTCPCTSSVSSGSPTQTTHNRLSNLGLHHPHAGTKLTLPSEVTPSTPTTTLNHQPLHTPFCDSGLGSHYQDPLHSINMESTSQVVVPHVEIIDQRDRKDTFDRSTSSARTRRSSSSSADSTAEAACPMDDTFVNRLAQEVQGIRYRVPEPEFNTPSYNPQSRERFRRKLKYHFMNPIDKWRAKGKLPWKLGLQVIKIIVVTLQLLLFGASMSQYMLQQGNMVITFRELFMTDWDPVREVMAFPPTAGPYAVYTKEDFYKHINRAVAVYASIDQDAIGIFGYGKNISHDNRMSPIHFCKEFYSFGHADPTKYQYNYTSAKSDECMVIANETLQPGDPEWENFSSKDYFDKRNFTILFDRLVTASLIFPLRTIYLNSLDMSNQPDCYDVNVTISYNNELHDGQMLINLNAPSKRKRCNGMSEKNLKKTYEMAALNMVVITLCLMSISLCIRSLFRGNKLRRETVKFFHRNFGSELSTSDQREFIDLWIIMIIMNDFLIICGSILKLLIERRLSEVVMNYSTCSMLLGTGNLLVWMGLLRYLGFFQKYNILILTLKRAFPHVMRFFVVILLLYGGFVLCGWVVLGPYHIKFKSLSVTSECLFALLNGDDMFATFESLDEKGRTSVWWFCRIYLYAFICLFIYVVLSLFVAIIMDSYETIKDYYENGFPMSEFKKFVNECPDDATSSQYMEDRQRGDSLRATFIDFWARLKGNRSSYQRI